MDASKPDENANPKELPIIYNSEARKEPELYTTEIVSDLLGRTPARIRQISTTYSIGKKLHRRLWYYSWQDIMILESHLRKPARKTMRQPKKEVIPDAAIAPLSKELRDRLEILRERLFRLVWDVGTGLQNRLTLIEEKTDKRILALEEEIRGLKILLDNKEDEGGRGVLCLPRRAPLTLTTYEATKAAA